MPKPCEVASLVQLTSNVGVNAHIKPNAIHVPIIAWAFLEVIPVFQYQYVRDSIVSYLA